jgi:hypothetical protein
MLSRREALALLAAAPASAADQLSARDDAFLEDLSRRAFQYFIDHADRNTGFVRDRARATGEPVTSQARDHASIAATGFGLTALCIAAERGWMPRDQAAARARRTLEAVEDSLDGHRGWYYHFVNMTSGRRVWECELSSVDTALLFAGALTAGQYFGIERARRLYARIDFPWMRDGHPYLLSHGWMPERGFLRSRWSRYDEATVLHLLAIAAPELAAPLEAWWAWERTPRRYGRYRYLASVRPLFIHQFSHAWIDYRGRRDLRPPRTDYFANSVTATRAHRDFCRSLAPRFPRSYGPDQWGITSSDSARGYVDWGGPPMDPRIDGTLVPCAAAGSLMFEPALCLRALRRMQERWGARAWGRYGFADAFNPTTGWVASDVLGIDQGITLLSAENLRSAGVWRWFGAIPEIRGALARVLR